MRLARLGIAHTQLVGPITRHATRKPFEKRRGTTVRFSFGNRAKLLLVGEWTTRWMRSNQEGEKALGVDQGLQRWRISLLPLFLLILRLHLSLGVGLSPASNCRSYNNTVTSSSLDQANHWRIIRPRPTFRSLTKHSSVSLQQELKLRS